MILLHSKKHWTLMIWQQKSNTKHIFTMHQILRKIRKTCTTYMQVLDLKKRVALDLMEGFLHDRWGLNFAFYLRCSHVAHEPETGHYQKNFTWDLSLSAKSNSFNNSNVSSHFWTMTFFSGFLLKKSKGGGANWQKEMWFLSRKNGYIYVMRMNASIFSSIPLLT